MALRRFLRPLLLAPVLACGAVPLVASAQTTDGFHRYLVFPVVVDTASFTQRFSLLGMQGGGNVQVDYYPATGTTQATPIDCGLKDLSASPFASLRALCPTLAAGSQFGMLVLRGGPATSSRRLAGHSRVSNPQGQGFSVEAFPLHTFASAYAVATGLRRLAAGAGTPAFQTNCFVGHMPEFGTPSGSTTTVRVTIEKFDGSVIGSADVPVQPGQLTRLLDVFAATGAPAGDHPDAAARFAILSPLPAKAALVAFCTVQDNTSFGADFRIAKQEGGPLGVAGAKDDMARHVTYETASIKVGLPNGNFETQPFSIAAGDNVNTHVFYFHNPDIIGCALYDPVMSAPIDSTYGLEMRLSRDGAVVAGGNDVTQFSNYYTKDKPEYLLSENGRYTLEVESNGSNNASVRAYALRCTSGAGHTRGEITRYREAGVRF